MRVILAVAALACSASIGCGGKRIHYSHVGGQISWVSTTLSEGYDPPVPKRVFAPRPVAAGAVAARRWQLLEDGYLPIGIVSIVYEAGAIPKHQSGRVLLGQYAATLGADVISFPEAAANGENQIVSANGTQVTNDYHGGSWTTSVATVSVSKAGRAFHAIAWRKATRDELDEEGLDAYSAAIAVTDASSWRLGTPDALVPALASSHLLSWLTYTPDRRACRPIDALLKSKNVIPVLTDTQKAPLRVLRESLATFVELSCKSAVSQIDLALATPRDPDADVYFALAENRSDEFELLGKDVNRSLLKDPALKPLTIAIARNDLGQVRELLARGASPLGELANAAQRPAAPEIFFALLGTEPRDATVNLAYDAAAKACREDIVGELLKRKLRPTSFPKQVCTPVEKLFGEAVRSD